MENERDRNEKDEIEDREEECSEIDQIEFTQKLSINTSSDCDDDEEAVLIGTKGPVALRDFPHPRDLCANFPFNSTPHEKYCSKCYCVLCEVIAPCSQWRGNEENKGHCSISKKCRGKTEISDSSERKISTLKTEPEN